MFTCKGPECSNFTTVAASITTSTNQFGEQRIPPALTEQELNERVAEKCQFDASQIVNPALINCGSKDLKMQAVAVMIRANMEAINAT